jgi:hypothetical protein
MDAHNLAPLSGVDLSRYRLGEPQLSGAMAVVPLFGPEPGTDVPPPLTGLKVSKVAGYGNLELQCLDGGGTAIVPLHIGYIQDKAQNHAMCRAAFIGAGQKVMFRDACCVPQAQGGYLADASQWFFILPLRLRRAALAKRGEAAFGKLWGDIAGLNRTMELQAHGHLEHLVCGQRPYLTQLVSRFELAAGQVGALFFVAGKLAGIEIGPSARYFAETWMPLVCFCYGSEALYHERIAMTPASARRPLAAADLPALKRALAAERRALAEELGAAVRRVPRERLRLSLEETFLDMMLKTAESGSFAGQLVEREGELLYLSLAATPEWLAAAWQRSARGHSRAHRELGKARRRRGASSCLVCRRTRSSSLLLGSSRSATIEVCGAAPHAEVKGVGAHTTCPDLPLIRITCS